MFGQYLAVFEYSLAHVRQEFHVIATALEAVTQNYQMNAVSVLLAVCAAVVI